MPWLNAAKRARFKIDGEPLAPFLVWDSGMSMFVKFLQTLAFGSLFALPMAYASSETETQIVYRAVKEKYPSFSVFCQQNDEQRRSVTVQTVMVLMSQRKLKDPMTAGPQAGALLRQDCGIAAPAATVETRWLATAKPLTFDSARHELSVFSSHGSLANKVFTPKGEGPFPAVVLSHTAGGLQAHMLDQAKFLINAGYAVLAVDTWGSRGYSMSNESHPAESAKDAYDALKHLTSLSYIDKARIYQAGFSLGAFAAALLTSPEGARIFKSELRFRATVGHYGTCWIGPRREPRSTPAIFNALTDDMDRPLLMLMAAKDIETPPENCFPLLEKLKADGKPISWKIYPDATHGWDKQVNFVFRTSSGESMPYKYDAQITKDATEQMIAFFNMHR
jgi:dienelactone hydrolase